MPSGKITFSTGTFLINSSILLSNLSGRVLEGAVAGDPNVTGSTIKTTNNIPIIVMGSPSSTASCAHNVLRNLRLLGNGVGAGQHGIVLDGVSPFATAFNKFENIVIATLGGSGIRFISNCWSNKFDDADITFCNSGVVVLANANNVILHHCVLNNHTNYGIDFQGGAAAFGLYGCNIEQNRSGLNVGSSSVAGLTVLNCDIEANTQHQVIDGGVGSIYVGGYILGNSASYDGIQLNGGKALVQGVTFAGTLRYMVNFNSSSNLSFINAMSATGTPYNFTSGSGNIGFNGTSPTSWSVDNQGGNATSSIASQASALASQDFYDGTTRKWAWTKLADNTFSLINAANGSSTDLIFGADASMKHSGTKLGFYGVSPIIRALLATGAGHTVDDVITALQNLGLVKQS